MKIKFTTATTILILAMNYSFASIGNFDNNNLGEPRIITGHFYFDSNSDSLYNNAFDAGLDAKTVVLFDDKNGNGIIDENDRQIATATTDFNGMYSFLVRPDMEGQEQATYIVTPDLSSIDVDYQLFTKELLPINLNTGTISAHQVNFGFNNRQIITSTHQNFNDLKQLDMEIWPKPTHGPINIKFNGAMQDANFSIHVFSMNGKLISQQNLVVDQQKQTKYDLSYLNKGTYLVHLTDGNMFFSEKVILQ